MHKAINLASSIVLDFYATLFQMCGFKSFQKPQSYSAIYTKSSVSRAGHWQVDKFLAQFMPACLCTSAPETPHSSKSSVQEVCYHICFFSRKASARKLLNQGEESESQSHRLWFSISYLSKTTVKWKLHL